MHAGEAVYYDGGDGKFLPAVVLRVHTDDVEPYYTVSVNGREKSTVRERLRSTEDAASMGLPALRGVDEDGKLQLHEQVCSPQPHTQPQPSALSPQP